MKRRLGLAVVGAAAVVIGAGAPAQAGLVTCLTGCGVSGNSGQFDYTVPSDGRFYRWDLITAPDITATLQAPNERFTEERISNGDGTFMSVFVPSSPFVFDETAAPGRTSIVVWAPADFSRCGAGSAPGEICSASYNVWGNGTSITLSGNVPSFRDPPTVVRLSITAIPEPAAWALLILGFGAVGTMLRRQRSGLAAWRFRRAPQVGFAARIDTPQIGPTTRPAPCGRRPSRRRISTVCGRRRPHILGRDICATSGRTSPEFEIPVCFAPNPGRTLAAALSGRGDRRTPVSKNAEFASQFRRTSRSHGAVFLTFDHSTTWKLKYVAGD